MKNTLISLFGRNPFHWWTMIGLMWLYVVTLLIPVYRAWPNAGLVLFSIGTPVFFYAMMAMFHGSYNFKHWVLPTGNNMIRIPSEDPLSGAPPVHNSEMIEWLKNNVKKRYRVRIPYVLFSSPVDAVHFKLRWY